MTENSKAPEGVSPDATDGPPGAEVGDADTSVPIDAFFSPDDPIAEPEGVIPEEALFSPDDPLTRSVQEGVVTSLGGKAVRSREKARSLIWEIRHTAELLEVLARELREQGLEALKVNPESEPMDAMIRSFVAGYLVGQLDEEE